MKTTILILALLHGMTQAAIEPKEWRSQLLNNDRESFSREDRIAIAKGLRDELKRIDAYIPALKPEQEKWLDAELGSVNALEGEARTSKQIRILGSSEMSLRGVKNGLELLVGYADLLALPTLSRADEVYYWAQISYELGEGVRFSDGLIALARHGTITLSPEIRKQFFMPEAGDPWQFYGMLARFILGKVVVPLLSEIRG
jgi:hypothetical protein